MTFFEDLTPHTYSKRAEEVGVLNIGWLGEGQPFPTGQTSDEFRAALQKFCENPIWLHRGFHICEFCPRKEPFCGNGQIRVKDQNGIWYVAPTMISHYVSEHSYRPTDVFINAILNPQEIAKDRPR